MVRLRKFNRGIIFLIIIISVVIYGYYHSGKERSDTLEFSTTPLPSEGEERKSNEFNESEVKNESLEKEVTTTTLDNSSVFKNKTKTPESVRENETNESTKRVKEEKKNVTLKYFWSKYCVRCWLDIRKGGVLLKRLLEEHPQIEFIRKDIAFEENKEEMQEYKLVGVPSYVLEINNLSLVMPGPMSRRKMAKIEKAFCSKIEDGVCERKGY